MIISDLAQYFNDIAIGAHKKAFDVIKPEGSLKFVNQGYSTGTGIDWVWRVLGRISEETMAGVLLTVKPDPLGLGSEVILTIFVYQCEKSLNSAHRIYWAKFVDSEYIKYDTGRFKDDLAEEIAFQLRRACEYLVMVAPKLGEISVNEERIKQEMRILDFTLHRAN